MTGIRQSLVFMSKRRHAGHRNTAMKRSFTLAILTIAVGLSTARSAQSCMYIPWLDPFAWMGFYGCGYGGCGYNPCGYGGCNYSAGVMPRVYAPQAPLYSAPQTLSYPVAPASPGCNCTSSVQQPIYAAQPAMTAVQVPVTTYRAVTRYVPQTTYRTQYRAVAPSVAVAPQYLAYPGVQSYATPRQAYNGSPYATLPTYNTAMLPQTYVAPTVVPSMQTVTPGTIYTQPSVSPAPTGIASPVPGDIFGDHEYPTQSAVVPQQSAARQPIQQVRYARPTRTNAYPLSVR